MLLTWFRKAFTAKDEGMKKLIKLIHLVPVGVKFFLLKNYVRQCERKHALAFL
jgi:hypothetical protein